MGGIGSVVIVIPCALIAHVSVGSDHWYRGTGDGNFSPQRFPPVAEWCLPRFSDELCCACSSNSTHLSHPHRCPKIPRRTTDNCERFPRLSRAAAPLSPSRIGGDGDDGSVAFLFEAGLIYLSFVERPHEKCSIGWRFSAASNSKTASSLPPPVCPFWEKDLFPAGATSNENKLNQT